MLKIYLKVLAKGILKNTDIPPYRIMSRPNMDPLRVVRISTSFYGCPISFQRMSSPIMCVNLGRLLLRVEHENMSRMKSAPLHILANILIALQVYLDFSKSHSLRAPAIRVISASIKSHFRLMRSLIRSGHIDFPNMYQQVLNQLVENKDLIVSIPNMLSIDTSQSVLDLVGLIALRSTTFTLTLQNTLQLSRMKHTLHDLH